MRIYDMFSDEFRAKVDRFDGRLHGDATDGGDGAVSGFAGGLRYSAGLLLARVLRALTIFRKVR